MQCETDLAPNGHRWFGIKREYWSMTDSRDIVERIDRLADSIEQMVKLNGSMVGFFQWIIKGLLVVVCTIALGKELVIALSEAKDRIVAVASAETK